MAFIDPNGNIGGIRTSKKKKRRIPKDIASTITLILFGIFGLCFVGFLIAGLFFGYPFIKMAEKAIISGTLCFLSFISTIILYKSRL